MALKLGAEIDKIRALILQHDKLSAQANALKAKIDVAKEKLLAKVKKQDLEGAKGKLGQAVISETDVPVVENFTLFMKHVVKTKEFDLVRKQVNNDAARERWADRKKIPGVGSFRKVTLSIRGVK